ncbi:MAG TPA: FtsX-like permease family protein [Steroidobacteraceae bacterium]|jgi:putative ABC transport system permease protein|nr:FtsX-like permease family protein [Steroidobacteraceae bacterium]
MLRWLPLVWANLRRRKMRFAFTLISILLAFLMFGMLDALRTSLSQAVNLAGADRLMCMSKVNITVSLPRGYYEKVKAVPGVRAVVPFNWFGGLYKDSRQQLQVLATDPEQIVAVYPELKVKPEDFERWTHDRQGVIVGPTLANNFGWKVGDRIPLRSDIWRKADGGDTWEFNIDGIYDASGTGVDKATVYFHYDYFNESLQYGKDQVGWMVVRVANPDQSDALAARVDAMFANSPFETKTSTERVMIKQFLDQVGNIGLILVSVTTAVFFTMLLVTANTMAQSVSERTNEIGVLKTLGFSGRSILALVLLESLSLTFAGGLVGLGLAWLFAGGVGESIKDYFPVFRLDTGTFIAGITLMLAFGIVTGLWPALTAMRLKIVDALRRV